MATCKDIFDNEDVGIPLEVVSSLRSIVNFRFKQTTDGPNKDAYIAAFFLDPRESGAFTYLACQDALATHERFFRLP